MRKEYLVREEPIVVAGIRITPVARISVVYTEIRGARSFYAGKQPAYLIVLSDEGERAYSVTGQEVSIQQVISECPAPAVALEGRPVPPLPPH